MPLFRFATFMVVSAAAFLALLHWVTRGRAQQPGRWVLAGLALVVICGGMTFAKFGASSGWTPVVYYGLPAASALLLPPLALGMNAGEFARYAVLAFAVSPAIHVAFSLLLGWHEYLPFWHIPSIGELLQSAA